MLVVIARVPTCGGCAAVEDGEAVTCDLPHWNLTLGVHSVQGLTDADLLKLRNAAAFMIGTGKTPKRMI